MIIEYEENYLKPSTRASRTHPTTNCLLVAIYAGTFHCQPRLVKKKVYQISVNLKHVFKQVLMTLNLN